MSGTVGDNVARASGVIASAGGGAILQVKSLKVTASGSESGTTPSQLSQFDMSFAATKSDSKLLFQAHMSQGCSTDYITAGYFYDVTNGAIVGALADAAGSRQRVSWGGQGKTAAGSMWEITWGTWHEPGTTSSIDYTIYGNASGSGTMYINRTGSDSDSATYLYSAREASTFTIFEYAADTVTLT